MTTILHHFTKLKHPPHHSVRPNFKFNCEVLLSVSIDHSSIWPHSVRRETLAHGDSFYMQNQTPVAVGGSGVNACVHLYLFLCDDGQGEIKKEMERRKLGKEMLDFKRKNEDEKTKRILDERNREKTEEKAARERVKAQIALDRADRAARYANNNEEVEAARLAALQARQAEAEAKKKNAQRERSAIARIQFRLPDGSFFTNQFPSEARLQEARQFAVNEVGNRYGNFSLATVFPRREFTADDLDKTLLELELAPSASIVLLPQTGRPSNMVVQSTSGGGIWAVLGTILYPLLAVWRFLSGFLFTSPPIPGAAGPRGPAQQPNSASGASSSSGEPKRETLRKRTLEKKTADFKRDGKIHRLRNHEDSEDENNTWNGNSTQQM